MSIDSLNGLDWFIAIVIAASALLSFKRGFFREALSLVIWFFAVIISFTFYEHMAVILQGYIDSASLRKVAAIVSLFVICLLVGGLFSFLMGQLIQFTGLGTFDRLLGMCFGFLRGIVIVVVMLMVIRNALPVYQESWWQDSVLVPHVLRMESSIMLLIAYVRDLVTPIFSGFF